MLSSSRCQKEERPDLELVLNELLAEGKIEISKRGKYKIAKEKTVTGTFVTHPKGFGFIEVEGRDDDIYVSEENIGNAFYGDVVQATLISGTTGKRQEGRITQVISHTVKEVVGIYEQSKHFGFVIPDNQKILQDIFIPQECAKGAVNGHKVIAEITSYGSSKKKPEAGSQRSSAISVIRGRMYFPLFMQKIFRLNFRKRCSIRQNE